MNVPQPEDGAAARLTNFGRNVSFQPHLRVIPENAGEVVECLGRYRGRQIRAVGSLHSWSRVAVGHDVVVDLRRLNTVSLRIDGDGRVLVEAGAGCTVDRVLDYLESHGGFTLPSYGIIGTQTIAGAIATATHSAGRSSVSHYVDAVRVAAYDESGERARIYDCDEGDHLRAARGGLGCLGVVVAVRLRVEDAFLIDERTAWCASIAEVLAGERDDPLQQFFLIPWSWTWFVRRRREARRRPPERQCGGSAPRPIARRRRRVQRRGQSAVLDAALVIGDPLALPSRVSPDRQAGPACRRPREAAADDA